MIRALAMSLGRQQARRDWDGVRFAQVAIIALWGWSHTGNRSEAFVERSRTYWAHPLAGAVVMIQDRTTLVARSYLTQNEGSYHFEDLSGDLAYHLGASWSGLFSHSEILSKLDSRKVAVIDLTVGPPFRR